MKKINYERGEGLPTMLLLVGGLLVLWLLWEVFTGAIGSGIQEQREADRMMMQGSAMKVSVYKPVEGGVKNHSITY